MRERHLRLELLEGCDGGDAVELLAEHGLVHRERQADIHDPWRGNEGRGTNDETTSDDDKGRTTRDERQVTTRDERQVTTTRDER